MILLHYPYLCDPFLLLATRKPLSHFPQKTIATVACLSLNNPLHHLYKGIGKRVKYLCQNISRNEFPVTTIIDDFSNILTILADITNVYRFVPFFLHNTWQFSRQFFMFLTNWGIQYSGNTFSDKNMESNILIAKCSITFYSHTPHQWIGYIDLFCQFNI